MTSKMIIRLILLCIFAMGGVSVGYLLGQDNGYVLLAWRDDVVQMSLSFTVVATVVVWLAFYFIVRFVFITLGLGGRYQDFTSKRKGKRIRQFTNRGLIALWEGNWVRARKYLTQSAKEASNPLVNYIAASRAAHEQQDYDARDEFLAAALQTTHGAELAVGITKAELQIESKQSEQALATLKKLRQDSPKNTHVLKLIFAVHKELKEWHAVQALIPELKKHKLLEEQEQQTMDVELAKILLDQIVDKAAIIDSDIEQKSQQQKTLAKTFRALQKSQRDNDLVVLHYVLILQRLGAQGAAVAALRKALNNHWSEVLALQFGVVIAEDAEQQKLTAQTWLKERPNNAPLMLSLGRICLALKDTDSAKAYLDASISVEKSADALAELAQLQFHLGNEQASLEAYRQAWHSRSCI